MADVPEAADWLAGSMATNPGNSVNGLIFFDLPRGDKVVKAELYDGIFSDGVIAD